MLPLLASLRAKLLAAMVLVAVAGLAGSYALLGALNRAGERTADRDKALVVARAVAAEVSRGIGRDGLAAIQGTLPNDRLFVYRNGRLLFSGPPLDQPLELTVSAPFPGGRVVLADHESTAGGGVSPVEIVSIAGSVIALVILAALIVATGLVRALRRPIEEAATAARRVAAGDLTARIGETATEFAELGSTFDEMAERLEAADRDQRRFLRDVAHEIATPVNAIRGFATALADGTMGSEADRSEAIDLIESQGRRLDALLEDLRRLTRLDLTETVAVETIDLALLCRDLVTRFRAEATAASVSLGVVRQPRSPVVFRSDRRLIETVLDNLLSNAIRYTPGGGSIEVSADAGPDTLTVAVKDTGIGIPHEHQKRIFDRLYRVDEARDRVSGGSGLGLAIAQRAAHALGGHVELESEPGVGSEFRLVMPMSSGA